MPMIDHNSLVQLISHVLLHDAGVQALVENRVHGGWARDTDVSTIQKPLIGFTLDGGTRLYEGVYGEFGVELWALSSDSSTECLTLYNAASDVLKAECLTVDGLDHRGQMFESDSPRGGWLASQGLWHHRSRWILRAARTTIGPVT